MRVAVTGATGRTGGEVLAAALDRDLDVVFATSRNPPASPVAGVEVDASDEFASLLDSREPNVVVDFTGPASTVEYAEACAAAGVAFVTGTTGLSDDQQAVLDAASDEVPVLQAANFARGVQALLGVVADAVAALPGYDVELVEAHHDGKRDAPSGTAEAMLDEVDGARERNAVDAGDAGGERVHGREGDSLREPGEVGVHSLRAGDVPGEHELVLAGNHEELRLQHRATDRGVFAAGALDAAEWVSGREPGRYAFADVVADDGDRRGDGDTGDEPADIVGTDGGQVATDAGDEQ